jgi:hypothetical protein
MNSTFLRYKMIGPLVVRTVIGLAADAREVGGRPTTVETVSSAKSTKRTGTVALFSAVAVWRTTKQRLGGLPRTNSTAATS